ncbi:MAG TPA: alpha/beta hydrolase domain-containing protein [Candidatus Acidoferrum sp.]|nr:alpha/beta hydrolase domain-containing protein [Candidatus Acidoferrum sp.]
MPVTRFEILVRRPLAGGRAFGDVGPYEELRGRIHLAVDPASPANAAITDISLAPRDAAGRVACAADVSVLVPVDRARTSGRLLVDVVNRGNVVSLPNFNHAPRPTLGVDSDPHPPVDAGDGWLMRRGWTVVSCGWQCDLPSGVHGLLRLDAPEALDADGKRLKGRVYLQLQAPIDVPHFLLSDRGHAPYEAADLDERDAVLVVRDQPDGEPEVIARSRWRFARLDGGRVVPDPRHIHLDGGFARGRLYQVGYSAIGARLVSLGMVALRDCAAWLRHGGADEGNPAPGTLRHAYAYGRSQTGRLLRTMIHHDVNVDEAGRRVFDGIIANVAGAMLGEFNDRFGQNSKDRGAMMDHYEPRHLRPRGGLKVFFTNTSFEYHRGDASLVHTDAAGVEDVDPGPDVRVYHFTGTEHAFGAWPPIDDVPPAADVRGWTERSRHPRSVVNYGRLLRAGLANLDRWVTEGIAPPPSRHPRLSDGTAVDPDELAKTFDRILAACYPRHHPRPQRQDWSTLPPRPAAAYGTRVSAVDEDGNERAGVAVPEVTVPLATHTGWNLRHPDIGGAEQMLYFAGATLPFPRTRAERESTGDPRVSIAERYGSREDYLARVRAAAQALAAGRYMLEEDVELSLAFAARMWDAWA